MAFQAMKVGSIPTLRSKFSRRRGKQTPAKYLMRSRMPLSAKPLKPGYGQVTWSSVARGSRSSARPARYSFERARGKRVETGRAPLTQQGSVTPGNPKGWEGPGRLRCKTEELSGRPPHNSYPPLSKAKAVVALDRPRSRMEKRLIPTLSQIRSILEADLEIGRLFWKKRPESLFANKAAAVIWNKKYPGREAFTAINSAGYRVGKIFDQYHRAHRVIWLLHTGKWPLSGIDHIDGIRSNNGISNLREVCQSGNNLNRAMSRNNTSGITGVSWHSSSSRWQATIQVGGVARHLGYFELKRDAHMARQREQVLMGFSVRHGLPLETPY